MSIDRKLKALFDLFCDEVKRNDHFRARLQEILGDPEGNQMKVRDKRENLRAPLQDGRQRSEKRGNRRPPALVDPVTEGGLGERHLREKLAALDLEQLRDVIADFRMDQSKLVMKWKDRERIIDHIVLTALNRGQKGDAFRA